MPSGEKLYGQILSCLTTMLRGIFGGVKVSNLRIVYCIVKHGGGSFMLLSCFGALVTDAFYKPQVNNSIVETWTHLSLPKGHVSQIHIKTGLGMDETG